jgi:hypothetical protein
MDDKTGYRKGNSDLNRAKLCTSESVVKTKIPDSVMLASFCLVKATQKYSHKLGTQL